ncbi:MAG: YeeE/YedE family protein [Sulfitobacter sp.]
MPLDWLYGLLGGLMIGSAAALYLLANGRIMGASGIIGGLVDGSARAHWRERLSFLAGLIAMPALINLAAGQAAQTHLTGNAALILLAGLLVGLGTRIGNGCTSGHGVCGISRLNPRGIISTLVYIAAGALVVALLRLIWGAL